MPSYVFSEELYPDQLYTEEQSRWLVNLQRVSGGLSVLGSASIIFIVSQDWQRKKTRVYHRLLFVYSIVDVIVSFNHCLSSWIVPEGTPGVYGAAGTTATCEASGFVAQFFLTLVIYGSFICVYYTLILRYQVREEAIAKKIEPWVHGFAFLVPMCVAIAALPLNVYNPARALPGLCTGGSYPIGCNEREELECERGDSTAVTVLNFVVFAAVLSCFLITLLSSLLTYLKIRTVQRHGARWAASREPSKTRVHDAGIQASLYVATFFFTYSYVLFILFGPTPATKMNRGFYFPVAVLGKISLPLQGFWNFFTYVRPRFVCLRRRNPHLSRWGAMKEVIRSKEGTGNVAIHGAARRRSRLLNLPPRILGSLHVSRQQQGASTVNQQPITAEVSSSPQQQGQEFQCEDEEDEFLPEFNGSESVTSSTSGISASTDRADIVAVVQPPATHNSSSRIGDDESQIDIDRESISE